MNREIRGLNGIRAISVLIVLIYHITPTSIKGGFLGVDIFFILSGYLITSILLQEFEKNNFVSFKNFILKRIRRLLPACYFMLIIISIFLRFTNIEILIKSKYKILFSFLYLTNIHSIVNSISYFENFNNISPVLHLWSLAVEMQFYIIYIVIICGIIKFSKKEKVRNILLYTNIVLIILSFIYTRYLFLNTVDYNRIYYGTDTRIIPILLGSIFSIYMPFSKIKKIKTNVFLEIISLIIMFLTFININPLTEFLYSKGGNVLIYVVYILCISVLVNSYFTTNSVMNYIGKISYGLYIWHYPIFILLDINIVFKVIILFIISMISYHFVEEPIRKYGFKTYLNSKFKLFSCILMVVIFLFSILYNTNSLKIETEKKDITSLKIDVEDFKIDKNTEKKEEITNNIETNKLPKYNKLLCIGDSLAYNIAYAWGKVQPNLVIDAQGGRYLFDAIDIADKYKSFNTDRSAVVIILGTNGPINMKQIDKLLTKFNKADIYFLTVNAPVSWEESVNDVLHEAKNKYPEITIIDWKKESENRDDLFIKDKVHVNKEGAKVMIELIENSFLREFEINEKVKPKYNMTTEMRNDMVNRLKKEKLKNKNN